MSKCAHCGNDYDKTFEILSKIWKAFAKYCRATVSLLNPLTYVVDALRTSMLAGSPSTFGLTHDYAVILLTSAILVLNGARLYPRLAL